ncbi:MAG: hypothetical protein HLUCCO02_09300 [Idiomarinaceae bacterium HL-53]|nr:MAG: hypothetical protein HLUCCO02_09300 [Idiomarinaceae bacterium HL-53]
MGLDSEVMTRLATQFTRKPFFQIPVGVSSVLRSSSGEVCNSNISARMPGAMLPRSLMLKARAGSKVAA